MITNLGLYPQLWHNLSISAIDYVDITATPPPTKMWIFSILRTSWNAQGAAWNFPIVSADSPPWSAWLQRWWLTRRNPFRMDPLLNTACFFRVGQCRLWRSWRDGLYLCNASYSPLLHHCWLPVPQTNGALLFVTIGPLQKAWCFALFEHSLTLGIWSRLPDSECFLFSARVFLNATCLAASEHFPLSDRVPISYRNGGWWTFSFVCERIWGVQNP